MGLKESLKRQHKRLVHGYETVARKRATKKGKKAAARPSYNTGRVRKKSKKRK
jgi:hypothetical protein